MLFQVYDLSNQFLPKEWIMAKWEEGFYITAMAGSTSGSSLVVMSKGTPYTQQSYKVCEKQVSSNVTFVTLFSIICDARDAVYDEVPIFLSMSAVACPLKISLQAQKRMHIEVHSLACLLHSTPDGVSYYAMATGVR